MLEHTVHKPPNSLEGKFPSLGHIHSQQPGINYFPHTSGAALERKKKSFGNTTFPKHSQSTGRISWARAFWNWDSLDVKTANVMHLFALYLQEKGQHWKTLTVHTWCHHPHADIFESGLFFSTCGQEITDVWRFGSSSVDVTFLNGFSVRVFVL